jgi:integrase
MQQFVEDCRCCGRCHGIGDVSTGQDMSELTIAPGLGHLRFHDLRRSAMINSGIDLYTDREVLGHRTRLSTKRFSRLSTQALSAAVAAIGKKVHSAA